MKPGNLRKLRDEEREPLPAIEPGARAPEHVFCPHCERELDVLDGRCAVCKKSVTELGLPPATAESLRRARRAGRRSNPMPLLMVVWLFGLVAWAILQPGGATAIALLFAAASGGVLLLVPSPSRVEVFATRAQRSPYLDGLFVYACFAVVLLLVSMVILLDTGEMQVLSLVVSATCGLTMAFHLIAVVRRL